MSETIRSAIEEYLERRGLSVGASKSKVDRMLSTKGKVDESLNIRKFKRVKNLTLYQLSP